MRHAYIIRMSKVDMASLYGSRKVWSVQPLEIYGRVKRLFGFRPHANEWLVASGHYRHFYTARILPARHRLCH